MLTGVLFALAAATSWACYIMLAAATGRRFSGSSGLVIAMVLGAIVITPAAVISAGGSLIKPSVLGAGLAIALLSSVIPYRFEIEALRRVSGAGLRDLDEPRAGGCRARRRRAAQPGPVRAAVDRDRLRGRRERGAALGEDKVGAAPQA